MFNGNLLTTPQSQSTDCNLSIANHLPGKADMKTPGACGFLYGSVSRFQFSVGGAISVLQFSLPTGLSANMCRMKLGWRLVISMLFSALSLRAQSKPLVFNNVDVFDGYRILRGRTVTVEDGMIRSVTAAGVRPPDSAVVIDGAGRTLLPGLIDAHVHIGREESTLEQAAALGVTTVLDMWGDPTTLIPLKKEIERGEHPNAADFRTAGTGATVPRGHPTQMEGPKFPTLGAGDDVQTFVDARFAEGSDYLKIIYDHFLPTLSAEQLHALVLAAHKRNRLVVAHEGTQSEGLEEMRAGVDGIEHIFDDAPISREFLDTAVVTHAVFTPTLSILQALGGNPTGSVLATDPRFEPYILGWAFQILTTKLPGSLTRKHHYENAQAAVRALHDAGITILAGTDSPNPDTSYGVSLHQELLLLTECGFSNEEALRAATSSPAREFGLVDRGRIETGRRADLLLVKGDPSKDIRATRDIVGVWKMGIAIQREEVAKRAAESRKNRQD
jgi:imidazolonepropionase-like amidohydrolase